MPKSKVPAVIEGEGVVVDESLLKAQASLADCLKRHPGLEGELSDAIAYVGLPDPAVVESDPIVEA